MPIRFALPDNDAPAVREIYAPSVATHITFELEVPSVEEMRKRIMETKKTYPWLVYEEGGVIAGYSYATQFRTRAAYAWTCESVVYVRDGFHGRGIGTQLYRRLFELLKHQGFVNVIAGIALPNDPSVHLHESLGFKRAGLYRDTGYKNGRWIDTGWWQLQLQRPERPEALRSPTG